MTAVLYVLYLLMFLMCLNLTTLFNVAQLVWAKKKFHLIVMIATDNKAFQLN